MINNSDKQYSGGLIFGGGGGAYIWNEVSVSTCGGLIHGGAYIRGGGLYSEVYGIVLVCYLYWPDDVAQEAHAYVGKRLYLLPS